MGQTLSTKITWTSELGLKSFWSKQRHTQTKNILVLRPDKSKFLWVLSFSVWQLSRNQGGGDILRIILRTSRNQLMDILRSSQNHLMIIVQTSHDHLTISLWTSHDHLTISLQAYHSHLYTFYDPHADISQSSYGFNHLMDSIILWIQSSYGFNRLMDSIVLWIQSSYGFNHLMDSIILWIQSSYGFHLMISL